MEALLFVIKIMIIAFVAIFIGYRTGLFSLGRIASVVIFVLLLFVCSMDLYSAFFRPDISLVINFKSNSFNYVIDLSFFIRIIIMTLLLGLICSVFGVKFSAKVNTVKELCMLALLISITAILSIYCTFRPGPFAKIQFKFISVFITAVVFGPAWGAIVSALGDVLAHIIVPAGPFLPQITMVEFFYGFVYGIVFFNMQSWNGYKSMIKIVGCVIFQIVFLHLGLANFFLAEMYEMSFETMLKIRSVPGIVNMAIQLVTVTILSKYISSFRKAMK